MLPKTGRSAELLAFGVEWGQMFDVKHLKRVCETYLGLEESGENLLGFFRESGEILCSGLKIHVAVI